MKKMVLLLLSLALVIGSLSVGAEEIKVPFGAIKPSRYGKIDMAKAEFPLSKVGKECVTKEWLEANLPKTSAEDTTTKDKPTKSLTEKLKNAQEWVIEPGEKVVLEDIDMEPPTDFIVKEGGSLIIRNCDLYMVGKHHHDNYIEVYGSLSIINSNLQGEKWIGPYILSKDPNASVKIEKSKLGKGPAGFHVDLRKGGSITLEEVDYLDALSIYGNKTAVEEGGSAQAQGSTINTLEFRLGSFTGDFRLVN